MKKIFTILIVAVFLGLNLGVIAQPPPPPPDPSFSGTHPPVGGSAPVGNGGALLVLMAMSYGLIKCSQKKKSEDDTTN